MNVQHESPLVKIAVVEAQKLSRVAYAPALSALLKQEGYELPATGLPHALVHFTKKSTFYSGEIRHYNSANFQTSKYGDSLGERFVSEQKTVDKLNSMIGTYIGEVEMWKLPLSQLYAVTAPNDLQRLQEALASNSYRAEMLQKKAA